MSINPINRKNALKLLRSHDLPRVTDTGHEITAWCECHGPGGWYWERRDFLPDVYGLFDLNAIRDWLGY